MMEGSKPILKEQNVDERTLYMVVYITHSSPAIVNVGLSE